VGVAPVSTLARSPVWSLVPLPLAAGTRCPRPWLPRPARSRLAPSRR